MPSLPKPSNNLTRTFLVRPEVHFTTQHEDEEVVLVVRKHILTQFPWIFNAVIFVILAMVANLLLPQAIDPRHIFVFNLFAAFFIFSYIWVNFLLWYFTIGMVTTERIIDLDFLNILYKEFSATTILQVSDITTMIGGFFGSLFHFGDVLVKTEGFQQNIEFDDVPNPSEVVKIINSLMPKDIGGPR